MRRGRLKFMGEKLRKVWARRRDWATEVKRRDQWKCQVGGCHNPGSEAHHVYPKGKYPDLATFLSNGLTLCSDHHREWHSASKLWRQWWEKRWVRRAGVIRGRMEAKKVIDTSRERA